jgi:hypothetical protein
LPLLDELSTFVRHQIIQRRAAKVVLTVRDGEPIPTGVHEVWTAGQFERLDLEPLTRDETTGLVSAALGGSVDPNAAAPLLSGEEAPQGCWCHTAADTGTRAVPRCFE